MSGRLDVLRARTRLSDPRQSAADLVVALAEAVRSRRLRGCVVAVSGGVDSATCLAIAKHAVGVNGTLALALPDRDSDPASLCLGQDLASHLGVGFFSKDVTELLDAAGCYEQQELAVRSLHPSFDGRVDRFRLEFHQDFEDSRSLPHFVLVVEETGGGSQTHELTPDAYLGIVAATNMKQRARMMLTHFHAEKHNYAVVGTSNRQELEQGFFVRYGDGTGDFFPLKSLLKSQVYDLAGELGIPEAITSREPSTDTYSAAQSQEVFFFGLPTDMNDILWDAYSRGESEGDVAEAIQRDRTFVANVFAAFRRRASLSRRLRSNPLD